MPFLFLSVLKDPDGNPYSLLDNTETDQTADTDASESQLNTNRRRRSRRRRTDEDTTVMDGMSESDNTSLSENGLGKLAWEYLIQLHFYGTLDDLDCSKLYKMHFTEKQ